MEITKCDSRTRLQKQFKIWRKFPLHTIVTLYAQMDFLRGIDRHIIIMAKGTDRLDVVCVIMRNQDSLHRTEINAIIPCMLLERS